MNVHLLFLYVLGKNYANEKIELKQKNHEARRREYLKHIRDYRIFLFVESGLQVSYGKHLKHKTIPILFALL